MARNFLGKGWQFPVTVDARTRKISMSEKERDVREAIWLILSTAKGERVMQPDFGCDIHDFVFSTINMTNLGLIETSVREALITWEPRIEINEVTVSPDRGNVGKLSIEINYRIRSTNNEFNLVYPFYLEGG